MEARWAALSPLGARLPGPLRPFTRGELLCGVASLAVLGGGMASGGGCGGSGEFASLPLALTFMTAAHNSIFTFFLGLPFERALLWHKFFAAWTVALGVSHGAICGGMSASASGVLLTGAMAALLG